jgi:hypothetical protein
MACRPRERVALEFDHDDRSAVAEEPLDNRPANATATAGHHI